MTEPILSITKDVLQALVRTARSGMPSEVCGFIVASKERPEVGERLLMMKNMAVDSEHAYEMDDDAVRAAYATFDTNGDEPIAVYHSHVSSEPLMSDLDIRKANDQSLVYVIVGLEARPAKVRAYRVKHFVGNTEVHPVEIAIAPDPPKAASAGLLTPWVLAPGNRVRITYQRANKSANSTCVATVVACGGEAVQLEPDYKTAARLIPLARIRSVHVIVEGRIGANMRRDLESYSGQVRNLLAGNGISAIPSLLATLSSAFPPDIEITMEDQ